MASGRHERDSEAVDYGAPVGDGLRDARGSLIGGLNVDDYNRGVEDFEEGRPPSGVTSASYDLGRQYAASRRADQAETERLLAGLEAERQRGADRVRAMLPPEQQAAFDRQQADIRSGRHDAALLWHSLSAAQRRLVGVLAAGGSVARNPAQRSRYDVVGAATPCPAATAPTVKALVARRVLRWSGPAADPECSAVLAERGGRLLEHARGAEGAA